MTPRDASLEAFLAAAGWAEARRTPLAGDASARRYLRLRRAGGATAVAMDAPPGCGDEVPDFLRIAGHLASIGLSPPAILAEDAARGFLLLEDLGDALVSREAGRDGATEARLYEAAVDVLIHLQAHPAPPGLPDLSARDWAEAARLAPEVYAEAATGQRPEATPLTEALAAALEAHADGPRVLILRDYHAGNLIDLPDRAGPARLGLLDFQLAQMGQPAYDLVSLLQDARRDVPQPLAAALAERFRRARGDGAEEFAAGMAVLGAQRALRILGVFARLCTRGGKSGYLPMVPRVWGQLQQNLAHPALSRLRRACDMLLPPPTPDVLERIRARCAPQTSR